MVHRGTRASTILLSREKHVKRSPVTPRTLSKRRDSLRSSDSIARLWKPREFDSFYNRYICREEMQFGGADFYRRYRSRYKECVQRFAALAAPGHLDVLEVGGG